MIASVPGTAATATGAQENQAFELVVQEIQHRFPGLSPGTTMSKKGVFTSGFGRSEEASNVAGASLDFQRFTCKILYLFTHVDIFPHLSILFQARPMVVSKHALIEAQDSGNWNCWSFVLCHLTTIHFWGVWEIDPSLATLCFTLQARKGVTAN